MAQYQEVVRPVTGLKTDIGLVRLPDPSSFRRHLDANHIAKCERFATQETREILGWCWRCRTRDLCDTSSSGFRHVGFQIRYCPYPAYRSRVRGVAVATAKQLTLHVEFDGETKSPQWTDFKLNPARFSMQMDLTSDSIFPPLLGGPKGKTTIRCIYELKGDKLKICMGTEGRPRSFTSTRDGSDTVLIYKRIRRLRSLIARS